MDSAAPWPVRASANVRVPHKEAVTIACEDHGQTQNQGIFMTSAAELHRSSILVVDDERAIADTLAQILNLGGYAAVPAYSGEAAIASALRTPPELLIVDIVMRAYSLFGSTAAISLQNGPNRSGAN